MSGKTQHSSHDLAPVLDGTSRPVELWHECDAEQVRILDLSTAPTIAGLTHVYSQQPACLPRESRVKSGNLSSSLALFLLRLFWAASPAFAIPGYTR